jgi:hypothetical protein
MLIFKTKTLWLLVDKKEVKPIAPTTTQIIVKTPLLPLIGARNISAWENRDALVLTINKICLNNNVISHIQSCQMLALTWVELIRLYESQDPMTKMYLKD